MVAMNLLKIPLAVLATSLLLQTPMAQAQLSIDDAKELENQHKGEILRVRELVADSKIRYDAAGHLTGKWHAGRWTWHSSVELVGVDVKGSTLRIKANRLLLNYDQAAQRFASVRAGSVEIDIETAPDINGKIDLTKEWNKAFLKPTEDYPLDMQPYWRPFINCIIRPNTDECRYYEAESKKAEVHDLKPAAPSWKPNYPGVYTIGNSVKPPQMLSKSEPQYTDIARQARAAGTVMFEVIVRKNGFADIVRVIRPLGYGLEESAAEWILKTKFVPAKLNDSPVDVHLQIIVNFHLY
jgi:TonB family protein